VDARRADEQIAGAGIPSSCWLVLFIREHSVGVRDGLDVLKKCVSR
jgi:hypothetical protein